MHFDQPALEATLLDYVHEVEHMAERIQRLEKAIAEAIQKRLRKYAPSSKPCKLCVAWRN